LPWPNSIPGINAEVFRAGLVNASDESAWPTS
jgi:hypothetical protein